MEYSDFDNFMREKLENQKEPSLNQGAIDQFRERMSSYRPLAWHQKYRTELFVAASFILFTLLNGSIIWFGIDKREAIASTSARIMTHQIDSLIVSINELKNSQQQSSTSAIAPYAALHIKSNKKEIVQSNQNQTGNNPLLHTNSKLHLGSVSSLPIVMYERLVKEGVLLTDRGEAYLIITDSIKYIRHKTYAFEPSEFTIVYKTDTSEMLVDDKETLIELPKVVISTKLSNRMINKIEDRQHASGLGINIAPHIDFVKGIYQQGNGSITPRVGFTADWVVSPHWSIETSLDYLNTKLKVHKNFESLALPNVSTDLGNLESAQITTRTLSIPISFKYRWWLSRQHQLVLRAGYTPYLSLRSEYLYSFPYPGRPTDSDLTINTSEQLDQRKFYGNTLTVSAGITKSMKKNKKLETSLFYEKSLGSVGSQKLDMQLFGIRTALWFNLK